MTFMKLSGDGIAQFGASIPIQQRMKSYVSGQANKNPPQRLQRLRELRKQGSPKICLIRGEGIGDVLMTTPTVRALKTQDNADITYATNSRYLDGALPKVLKYNPDISKVIDRDFVDEAEYDLVINLHCPCLKHEYPGNRPPNRVDLFADHAGVSLADHNIKYYIQPEEIEWAKSFLLKEGIKETDTSILVHVFTTSKKRDMNIAAYKQGLMRLAQEGVKLVIVKNDSDIMSDILFDNIPGARVLKNADVRQIAGVIHSTTMTLCPDSSIMHLAGALNKPMIAIFGSTDPGARINYYAKASYIWPGIEMNCSPCFSGTCSMHFMCYKRITSDMIFEACVNKLNHLSEIKNTYLNDQIEVEIL